MMNSLCQISVIIPVYNAEKYLEECLECIQHSTFKDIEIISVDEVQQMALLIYCGSINRKTAV